MNIINEFTHQLLPLSLQFCQFQIDDELSKLHKALTHKNLIPNFDYTCY